MKQSDKIVCCCGAGQVRSVATRKIFNDDFHFTNVLAAGMESNSMETLRMLFEWADHIIIIGEVGLYNKVPQEYRVKSTHFNIGQDIWINPFHLQLRALLMPLVKELVSK